MIKFYGYTYKVLGALLSVMAPFAFLGMVFDDLTLFQAGSMMVRFFIPGILFFIVGDQILKRNKKILPLILVVGCFFLILFLRAVYLNMSQDEAFKRSAFAFLITLFFISSAVYFQLSSVRSQFASKVGKDKQNGNV